MNANKLKKSQIEAEEAVDEIGGDTAPKKPAEDEAKKSPSINNPWDMRDALRGTWGLYKG